MQLFLLVGLGVGPFFGGFFYDIGGYLFPYIVLFWIIIVITIMIKQVFASE